MENSSTRSWNTKRFVIEDNFTKVTSDGKPHGMLTMIAGISGLLAAIVILAILASLVGCQKNNKKKKSHANSKEGKELSASSSSFNANDDALKLSAKGAVAGAVTNSTLNFQRQRSSLLSLLRRVSGSTEEDDEIEARPRLVSVSCISSGNLEGNLNSAFVGSELNIHGSFNKKTHAGERGRVKFEPTKTDDFAIDMKRY